MSRVPFAAFLLGAWLALTAGCANYRLGTGQAPAFQTVYVEPISTQVLVPQAQALLASRIREALLRDGRVASANSPAAAEVTLTVVITEFRRDIAAARADDTGLARKFNVTLSARCTLRDRPSGRLIWDQRPVSVTREIFTDRGQLQAEYQVLALLTEGLAAQVVHAALDTW